MKLGQARIKPASGRIARPPEKRADAAYLTVDWKKLRAEVFGRDRYVCVVPGCGRPAKVCEHIVSRRKGGRDAKENLGSLCRQHDNYFKEDAGGERRNADQWHVIFAQGVGGLNSKR